MNKCHYDDDLLLCFVLLWSLL